MSSAAGPVPGSLWRLWDFMIRFDVRLLIFWLQHIEEFEDALLNGALYGGMHELTTARSPDQLLTNDGRKWLWSQLGPLQAHLEPLALSVGQIEIQYLWNHSNTWTGKEMAARLKDFRSKLEQELNDRFFLYLNASEAKLFENERPFGEEVWTAFPSAQFDAREAAQSLAVGRHTACVFHCMRVLEHGLRALAKDVQKTFDQQQWHNIIEEIESEIRSIAKTGPKTAEKDERLQWLSEAAKEFFYFKDGWRNYVAHGRSRYDGPQATSALEHVRVFMRHLAIKLSE
jgi:hypothetical protein